MTRQVLAATLAACCALGAHTASAAEFALSLAGSGTHWYVHGVPGCDFSNPSDPCTAGFRDEAWIGSVVVATDGSADGTYGYESGLQAIHYASGQDAFSYSLGDEPVLTNPQFSGGEPYLTGLMTDASVTIAGGRVVAIDATWVWAGDTPLTFAGLAASDNFSTGSPDSDAWQFDGVLTAVPEPAPALLLAAALLALRVRTRSSRSPCARPSAGR